MDRYLTWASARIVRILSVAAIIISVGFIGYYVWDNYLRPVPSILDQSMEHMEELIRANPGDPDLRVGVADIYLANGKTRQAITQYREALTVTQEHKGALFGLGRAYMALGDDDLAIDYFGQVIEIGMAGSLPRLDAELEASLYYLGKVHLMAGRAEQAIDALTQAIALSPMDADAIHLLGQAHQKAGRHQEAIAQFSRAVQFIPDWLEAYQDMAASYRALGDSQGIAYPEGLLALLNGQYQQAIERLEVATTVEPENANAHWALGAAYELTRQPEEALAAYQEALTVDPSHVLARAGAARLEQT